jgi:hypothetical protein
MDCARLCTPNLLWPKWGPPLTTRTLCILWPILGLDNSLFGKRYSGKRFPAIESGFFANLFVRKFRVFLLENIEHIADLQIKRTMPTVHGLYTRLN